MVYFKSFFNFVYDRAVEAYSSAKNYIHSSKNNQNIYNHTINLIKMNKVKIPKPSLSTSMRVYHPRAPPNTSLVVFTRQKRVAPFIVAIAIAAGHFLWWTIVAGAASSASYVYVNDIVNEKKLTSQLQNKLDDCNSNSFGCLHNACWAMCGPRIGVKDFCYAKKVEKPIFHVVDDGLHLLGLAKHCKRTANLQNLHTY